jgi:predicted nuclease with TOPRIM domain
MTRLGQILVYANVFISVGLFAWALSLFANRPTYFDRKVGEENVPGQFTQLEGELKRLSEAARTTQSQYAESAYNLKTKEQERAYRAYVLRQLLDDVQKETNPNAVFRTPPRDPQGLIKVLDFRMPDNPPKEYLNLRNQPLRGFGALQRQMTNLQKDERDLLQKIDDAAKKLTALSKEIYDAETKLGLQDEIYKMKAIRNNLSDEGDLLADQIVNWEEQLRTLELRQKQLNDRLAGK